MDATNKLLNASFRGTIAEAEEALSEGADINAATKHGETPLILAVNKNSVEMVEVLLRAGADANAVTSAGRTPLMTAAANKDTGKIRLLLDSGARIEARDWESGFRNIFPKSFGRCRRLVRT